VSNCQKRKYHRICVSQTCGNLIDSFSPKRHAGVKIKIARLMMEEEMSMLKSNNCCEKPPIIETGKAEQNNPITGLDRPRGFQ